MACKRAEYSGQRLLGICTSPALHCSCQSQTRLTRRHHAVAPKVVLRSRLGARQRGGESVVPAAAAVGGGRGAGAGGAQLGAVAAKRIDGVGGRVGAGLQKGAKTAILQVGCGCAGGGLGRWLGTSVPHACMHAAQHGARPHTLSLTGAGRHGQQGGDGQLFDGAGGAVDDQHLHVAAGGVDDRVDEACRQAGATTCGC